MYVLIGIIDPKRRFTEKNIDGRMRVMGPFDTADDARELANLIGSMGDHLWSVRPIETLDGNAPGR